MATHPTAKTRSRPKTHWVGWEGREEEREGREGRRGEHQE
jgi:hypothetical protein